jgi:hypothetical protein
MTLRTAADCRRDRLAREAKTRRIRVYPSGKSPGNPMSLQEQQAVEERWRKALRKVAVFAVEELSMDYRTFVAHAQEDYEWERLAHRIRVQKQRVRENPELKALREEEEAEIAWKAHLKRIEHQERLAKRRKH